MKHEGDLVGFASYYIYIKVSFILCRGCLKKVLLIYSIGVAFPSPRVRDSSEKPADKCNAMKRGEDLQRIARP